jgi:nickel-dependent lactate racemase
MNVAKKITVLTYPWHGDKPLDLVFPDRWDVVESRMAGHTAPKLTEEQIRRRLTHPVGTEGLRELAKGRKECVILVNDLSRPFKAHYVLPLVLDELHRGGITDDHIRFVIAPGNHFALTLDQIVKILGEDIPEKYLVFNHNCYENNVFIGETEQGNSVNVNKEVMDCDLKISVHGIIPHGRAGFGGGAKIVIPGIASLDTTYYNHNKLNAGRGKGRIEGNIARKDMEEATRMIGLDFIVNQIINGSMECCELVCGDPVAAHREGVKIARQHYVTQIVEDVDIAIGNGYPMDDEAYKGFGICLESLRAGGDVVLLIHCPEGTVGHYLNGRFGTNYGGKLFNPHGKRPTPYAKEKRTIIVAPHHAKMDEGYYGPGSIWVKSWAEGLEALQSVHGDRARVAIYPTAPIQISEQDAAHK